MRAWVLMATLLATITLATGCGSGMALTASERRHRSDKIFENDMKQLVDDIDMFLLNDRPLRTSSWSIE